MCEAPRTRYPMTRNRLVPKAPTQVKPEWGLSRFLSREFQIGTRDLGVNQQSRIKT